ncbi:hypothetical protein SAMN04490369_105018 [Vreelandella aquamarina]|uniref:Sulfotransferase family protein n=2 Tax=Vreelandella aquamarina TaxID=77097 RepID=A0A1H8MI21_9GAMM|nr:hypothetical protein SAMN04490369_105018 [Halomonas aquamarina]
MGPHKTGSTYIQKRLHENREALNDSGICYPDAYYLFFGHHYLLNALNGEDGVDKIYGNFSLGSCDHKDILISSENFIYLTKKGLLKLREVFSGYDLNLVYYIRRPSLRLLSRWHEEVKQGGVASAENYFVSHLFRPMQSSEVNNIRHVDLAIEIFGRNSIKLVDYDTAVAENNMLSLLLSVVGKDFVVPDVREDVNKMVSLAEIEIIRFLNFRALAAGLLKGSNVREAFYSSYEEIFGAVDELKKRIESHAYEVTIGDAGFDKAVQSLLVNEYHDLLINKPSAVEKVVKIIPSSNWMMETGLVQEASAISSLVFGKLESKNG